jgi:hypothetical protein
LPRRPTLRRSATPFPDAQVERSTGAPEIEDSEWIQIANDIQNCVYAAQSARQPLEENLRLYNRIYELYSEPRNEPFVDASSVFLPVAVAKLDALMAQIAPKVFVPDIFVVTGNDAQAETQSYPVGRWYNTEFRKDREDLSSKIGECFDLLFYSLLEGTSFLEVRWNRQDQLSLYDVEVPTQDENGEVSLNEDGEFDTETQEVQKTLTIDEASWRCRQLKDVLLIPNEAKNPAQAVATATCEWLYESDLWALYESTKGKKYGLKKEWIENLLVFDPAGQSDVASDRQGYWDKSAGGQVQIGQGQGSLASPRFKNRGPFKIWYYVSDQFDMNNDEVPEKNNVFWWAELSTYLLGWMPAKAISQRRNLFAYCPMPRKNSCYGFSILEREAPINAEINTIVNNLNDHISMQLKPPMLANMNNESRDDEYTWSLGKRWYVEDVTTAFKPLDTGNPVALQGALQTLSVFNSYADQLAGLSAPQSGGLTTNRKSAAEIKTSEAGSGARSDIMALFLRFTIRRAFQYEHFLNIQNLPDTPPPGSYMPTKEQLKLNYNLDVAGTGDPIDFQTYAQEYLSFYQLMSQDRDIQGDATKRFALKQQLGKVFRIENLEAILGTAEEAEQAKQQEAQQGQMAQQLQMQTAQAEIAHKLKGTPEEAANAQAQKQPPPVQDQTEMAKAQMEQQSDAQQQQQDAQQQQQQPPQQ